MLLTNTTQLCLRPRSAFARLACVATLLGSLEAQVGVVITEGYNPEMFDISVTGVLSNRRPIGYQSMSQFGFVGLAGRPGGSVYYALSRVFQPTSYPESVFQCGPNGGGSPVGGLTGQYFTQGDCALDPTSGLLWGMKWSGQLYTMDPAGNDSTATYVATVASLGFSSAMAFDASGRLWVLDQMSDRLLRLDKNTGAVQASVPVGIDLAVGSSDNAAMAFDPGNPAKLLAIAEVFNGSFIGTRLLHIDSTTGAVENLGATSSLIQGFVPYPGGSLNGGSGGGGNGGSGGGIYFDMQVHHELDLNMITVSAQVQSAGTAYLDVYLGPVSYVGHLANASAWTLVGTTTTRLVQAGPQTINLSLTSPVHLSPGNYGIALVAHGFGHVYSPGTGCSSATVPGACSNSAFANGDLTLRAGAAQDTFLSGTVITPAVFNGQLRYTHQGPVRSTAPIVINEFSYDDAGTDNFEFVELFNRTDIPIDISGWRILNPGPNGPTYGSGTTADAIYTIPPGTVVAPGGFFVLGSSNLIPAPHQVLGATNLLANNTQAIELRDLSNVIVDSVAYELGLQGNFGPHPLEGNGFYGDLAVGDGVGAPLSSIGRKLDGLDSQDNGRDFVCGLAPTPGGSNVPANAVPYAADFDLGVPGTSIGGWNGGFVPPRYVDPTAITSENLSVKPPSPQGGLAMSVWDSTGAGNTVTLESPPVADVSFEAYVWFEPRMTPVNPAPYTPTPPPAVLHTYNLGDGEWWAIGVRGSAAANANPPNVNNYFGTIGIGVGTRYHFLTGIAWVHFRTPTASELYLVDFGSGANNTVPQNHRILAGPIQIQAGVNDGWQRLRLHVAGNIVTANFGGTLGCSNGIVVSGDDDRDGGSESNGGKLYIAYREALLYNNNGQAGCRPLLVDQVSITVPTATKSFFGMGSPTSVGIPDINSNGYAMPGSQFRVLATNLVPAGAPGQALCGYLIGFAGLDPGYPIPGAPATAFGHVLPIAGSMIGFADAAGSASFPLSIPCDVTLLGATLVHQLIDLDVTMPFPLPIGVSRGMVTTVGN